MSIYHLLQPDTNLTNYTTNSIRSRYDRQPNIAIKFRGLLRGHMAKNLNTKLIYFPKRCIKFKTFKELYHLRVVGAYKTIP